MYNSLDVVWLMLFVRLSPKRLYLSRHTLAHAIRHAMCFLLGQIYIEIQGSACMSIKRLMGLFGHLEGAMQEVEDIRLRQAVLVLNNCRVLISFHLVPLRSLATIL
jgi:AraC-like DNA-binding protein